MRNQLNYIIEIASQLIIEGKATKENAIELAIKKDNEMSLNCIEDLQDMQKGYINEENKTQKAYNILLKSVYNKLQR